jgi:hypothetical protein
MKCHIFLLILFSYWSCDTFAQNEAPDRFSMSFGGGFSFPVGSYADNDAAQSATFSPEPYPFFMGFDKSKSGFAKTGSYYDLELNYRVLKSWQVVMQAGKFVNSVDDSPMSKFMKDYLYPGYTGEITVTTIHTDYETHFLIAGIGYTFSCKGLVMETAVLGGYATTAYPSYRIYFDRNGRYYGDFRNYPDPNAFMLGFSGSAKYVFPFKMFIGAEITYLQAGFDYTVENGNHPGGSTSYPFDDTLNVRVLNAGLKIGYQF